MKVKKILSNLNAWKRLNTNFQQEIADIVCVIENLDISQEQSLMTTNFFFTNELKSMGWENKGRWLFDCIKNKIGIELSLGKQAFLESKLFLKAPLTHKQGLIDIAIFVVPLEKHNKKFAGLNNFNGIQQVLVDLSPLQLQYPFVILGIGCESDDKEIEIIELTTDLDEYLINHVQDSLEALIAMGERTDYDFKEFLPENKKIAQEICAFANMNGGMLILGITDSGDIKGIDNKYLDEIQQRVINVIRDNCNPPPQVQFLIFNHNLIERSILVVEIRALENKPCMAHDKIYIRVGSSVRVAKPDEVRRLILM
ncbi:RNA-binding domain-containing protein [Paenibacillus xylanexedens]|uniref:RNA-binding domain-containing protein n=1 Tax=Paenibacillus xylanexedens TaxID=528191 RepID=UPI003D04FF00